MLKYTWVWSINGQRGHLTAACRFYFQHLTTAQQDSLIQVHCGRWYKMYASLLLQCQSNHAWQLPLMYIGMVTSKWFLFIVPCRVGLATAIILWDPLHFINTFTTRGYNVYWKYIFTKCFILRFTYIEIWSMTPLGSHAVLHAYYVAYEVFGRPWSRATWCAWSIAKKPPLGNHAVLHACKRLIKTLGSLTLDNCSPYIRAISCSNIRAAIAAIFAIWYRMLCVCAT